MTIEDRITELMAHHKESLARMVAESEPNEAAEIIAELRAKNDEQARELAEQASALISLSSQLARKEPLKPYDPADDSPLSASEPEAPAEPAQ